MARTPQQYKELLKQLLPLGRAWTRSTDSTMDEVLQGFSDEPARVDGRGDDLLLERDVTTTTELVTEHEEDFGLPEEGEELGTTLAERRSDLLSKLITRGQQDVNYFISIIRALGYTITIDEFTPAWAGVMQAGDPCGTQENLFYWKVNVFVEGNKGAFGPDFAVSEFRSILINDRTFIDTLVRSLDPVILKINKLKPGHTIALFDFYGNSFSRAFDWSFDSVPHNDGTIIPGSFDFNFNKAFAVNYDYDGNYLQGSFCSAFNLAFNAKFGGAFGNNSFSNAFDKEA